MRKLARYLGIFLIGLTGVIGLVNTSRDFDGGLTGLQTSVAFGVALYGVLGVLGAIWMLRRRPWCVTVAVAFAITVTYVASVASFAYHDPTFHEGSTWIGVLSAGVVTALVGWLVVWAARESVRAQPAAMKVDASV